jgi:hypothetical protein
MGVPQNSADLEHFVTTTDKEWPVFDWLQKSNAVSSSTHENPLTIGEAH